MNVPTLTGFAIPEDGWFHIATPGEWPHKPTGLVQVIDDDAMQAIVDGFTEQQSQPNWPGVLIDFDHQSLDQDKPTVAAGWIVELDKRPTGIWARIKWSDLGKQSIEGGRYRFISPVWRSSDCDQLGEDRIRPLKLMNCAVTNDPNIKGMFPLSNSDTADAKSITAPAMPIENRIRTDDERKAMFAAMGGGGGGGRGAPPVAAPAPAPAPAAQPPAPVQQQAVPPAAQPAPAPEPWWRNVPDAPQSHRAKEYENRIAELERQRDELDRNRPEPPAPPVDLFERIDPRQAMADAMRQPGATSTDVIAARNAAEAENKRRRDELSALRRQIRRQHQTREAQERAMQRELDKRERDYSRDLRDWQREGQRIDQGVSRLEKEIHQTQVRLAAESQRQDSLNFRQHQTLNREQERARQQSVREQIQSDIHAERMRQAEVRQQLDQHRLDRAEGTAVTAHNPAAEARAYRATQTARRDYFDAVRTGNEDYAGRIFPDADLGATRQIIQDFDHAYQHASATERRNAWNELIRRPPPVVAQ